MWAFLFFFFLNGLNVDYSFLLFFIFFEEFKKDIYEKKRLINKIEICLNSLLFVERFWRTFSLKLVDKTNKQHLQ